MFTCEGCGTTYQAVEETSVARLYVKDSRCNHVEARCAACGVTEVIYLGPNRMQEVLRASRLPVSVFAEASARLRVRAENAWAAAEAEADRRAPSRSESTGQADSQADGTSGAAGQPQLEGGTTVTAPPKSYDLTPRHEQLLATFGDALSNIPDDLLWDGLQGEHRGDLPARWID